jgi:cytochrome c553
MRKFFAGALLALLPAMAIAADRQLALPEPEWAYPEQDPNFQRERADDTLKTVPGSTRQLMQRQVGGFFGGIEDWFPERHGPMPDIVKNGRQPAARACAGCHLTSGQGHPSAGMSAGMSVEYFTRQVHELAAGQRNPRAAGMMGVAKALTEDEIKAAAEYYHRQKPQKWVQVVEAETVPVTWVGTGDFRQIKPGAGNEPIGYTRNGTQAALMQGVVDKLTIDDIVNIVAYVSSKDPS